LERTYAQKRHLESIFLAKSAINSHTICPSRSPSSNKNSHTKSSNELQGRCTADRSSRIKQSFSLPKPHLDLSATLNAYSSLNRLIKSREIEEENSKLFSRILTATPTLKRKCWAKMQQQNQKYKENLCRRKCTQM
jgi:hypothetical protein